MTGPDQGVYYRSVGESSGDGWWDAGASGVSQAERGVHSGMGLLAS